MEGFWEASAGTNLDLNWLLKIRSQLNKVEKEQEKTKQKKVVQFFQKFEPKANGF